MYSTGNKMQVFDFTQQSAAQADDDELIDAVDALRESVEDLTVAIFGMAMSPGARHV